MKAVIRKSDDVIAAYRIHGIAYLMGRTVREVLGEVCSKQSGCSLGKGGSAHMYAKHFFGGCSVVGAQVKT